MALPSLPPVIHEVVAALSGLRLPWAIAGGWAIDLALGRVTRPHSDVDVALFRDDQAALRAALPGWELSAAIAGVLVPWAAGDWLAPPVHEVRAQRGEDDAATGIEFLLNERAGADWVFRRDPRIRLPVARALTTAAAGQIPVLAPEVVLLYKAKAPRAVDEADFMAALPHLSAVARTWLAEALDICHPGHPWRLTLGAAEP
jgi:hypothetical protein